MGMSYIVKPLDLPVTVKINRLLVLVPLAHLNEDSFGRQVWELAHFYHANVLFLALARDDDELLRAEHRLAHIAAVTMDRKVHVTCRVEYKKSLANALNHCSNSDDLLVCLKEQTISQHIFLRIPLYEWLSQHTERPICLLTQSLNGHKS